jgi:ubiquinone/menaquinone biosynthesis C-methylase UbiE
MRDEEEKTIRTYDKTASNWATAHEIVNDWENEFKKLKKKYLSHGHVIDIGCGSGRDISILMKLGYECVGVDASKGMLNIAKMKNKNVKFIQLNIYELEKLKQQFDGFICMATLLHIPRQKISKALQQIKKILAESSVGIITLKKGEGEEFEVRDIDGRHEERFFVYWSKEDFESALKNNDFKVLEYNLYPIGRNDWHCFVVKNLG